MQAACPQAVLISCTSVCEWRTMQGEYQWSCTGRGRTDEGRGHGNGRVWGSNSVRGRRESWRGGRAGVCEAQYASLDISVPQHGSFLHVKVRTYISQRVLFTEHAQ